MKDLKIVCMIPVWKRPNILNICVENNKKFANNNMIFVYIVSENDPFIEQIRKILNGEIVFYHKNRPLGAKMNAGIEAISKHFKYDYLMNLGSDDMIIDDIYKIYNPLMNIGLDLFGYNSCYVKKISTDMIYEMPNANPEHCIGAGRMIKKEIIENCGLKIYDDNFERGLDSNSMQIMKLYNPTLKPYILDGIAPIVDIKSEVNINTFEMVINWGRVREIENTKYKFNNIP